MTWRRACSAASRESRAGAGSRGRPEKCGLARTRARLPLAVSILVWIALGLGAGAVVGWLRRRRGRQLLGDLAVGVLGAMLGGFMASVTLGLDIADLNWTSVLVAAVGAAILILILNALPANEIYE